MMKDKKQLEHQIALLKGLLELEQNRFKAERDKANQWKAESERKDKIIDLLKLMSEKKQNAINDWHLIKKHFHDLIEEEGLPYKHVKDAGKKRIRREANDRAKIEDINVRRYSDKDLSRELQFPEKPMLRRFARQHKKK